MDHGRFHPCNPRAFWLQVLIWQTLGQTQCLLNCARYLLRPISTQVMSLKLCTESVVQIQQLSSLRNYIIDSSLNHRPVFHHEAVVFPNDAGAVNNTIPLTRH